MCIQAEGRTALDNTSGEGFKAFRKSNDGRKLEGDFSVGPRPVGRWLKAEEYQSRSGASELDYAPGFHVFETLAGAKTYIYGYDCYVIRRVKYRNAYLKGFYYVQSMPIIVAKEIRILPDKPKEVK